MNKTSPSDDDFLRETSSLEKAISLYVIDLTFREKKTLGKNFI